ncbi:MAG: hypothetical protein NTY53_11415 [Kiritimatiellaeota bacterium]|nr:hypothetical protein [Kiritimatiellota bacterium]
MRNGSAANWVEFSFGGRRFAQALAPGAVAWWPVEAPRSNWVREPGHTWYEWRARACYGCATVLLATRPEEIGAFLFNADRAGDAAPLLAQAAAATHNPALALLAARCATGDLTKAAPSVEAHNRADFLKIFGITPDYLNALDFVTIAATECGGSLSPVAVSGPGGVQEIASATTNLPPSILSPLVQLDPGAYTLTLYVRHPTAGLTPPRWQLTALDLASNVWLRAASMPVAAEGGAFGQIRFMFQLQPGAPELRLDMRPENSADFLFSRIEIKPDIPATVQWLQHPTPVAVSLTTGPSGVKHKVDTLFHGGVRMLTLQTSSATVRRNEALGINLQFQLEQPDLDLANLAVFVHFVSAAGVTMFQGDYSLAGLFNFPAPRLAPPAVWQYTIVPTNAVPGSYSIRTGIYRLHTTDRLRIVSSPYPYKIKAVLLPAEVRVTD